MTDTSTRSGGQPPTSIISGRAYNPIAGASDHFPDSFPPGTPLAQSRSASGTAVPARANSVDTASVVGLAAGAGVVGNDVVCQFQGVLTLTTEEWDAITTLSGGLTPGAVYYLSPGFREGQLSSTKPTSGGDFVTQVGIALSPTDMMIQISATVGL